MAALNWSECPALFKATRTPVAAVFEDLEDGLTIDEVMEQFPVGELLNAAEAAGFDVFVTTDRNSRHQQNPTHRKIAIVVLEEARLRQSRWQ